MPLIEAAAHELANKRPVCEGVSLAQSVMRLDRVCGDDGSPLPLPACGGGLGCACVRKTAGRVDRLPPPAALRAVAEAQLRRLI